MRVFRNIRHALRVTRHWLSRRHQWVYWEAQGYEFSYRECAACLRTETGYYRINSGIWDLLVMPGRVFSLRDVRNARDYIRRGGLWW